MYKFTIVKAAFSLKIEKIVDNQNSTGILLKINKEIYTVVTNGKKEEIFQLKNNKWNLVSDNIVSFLKNFNVYEYDEIYFLEAIILDLLVGSSSVSSSRVKEEILDWLPGYPEVKDKYYIFRNHKLIALENGYEYEYDMPSNLGISHENFLNPANSSNSSSTTKTSQISYKLPPLPPLPPLPQTLSLPPLK